MEKLTDLRLIIGLFFSLSGIILLVNYLADIDAKYPELNLYSGIAMLVFGLLMLLFFYKGDKDNA
jgi:uncharacterized membrane protein HdeD (DUF308 family)